MGLSSSSAGLDAGSQTLWELGARHGIHMGGSCLEHLSGPALGYEAEPTSLEIRAQGGRALTAPVVTTPLTPWGPRGE